MKKEIMIVTVFLAILIMLPMGTYVSQGRTEDSLSPPQLSIVNPGPSTNPSKWNASSTVRDLGSSNFLFFDNETTVGSTFFMNITIATNDTAALYGWGVGLVYDNTTLQFMSAFLPTDHVFDGAAKLGYTIIKPSAIPEDINDTFSILKWGASYIMGEDVWTFNGTGQLCQLQFRIRSTNVSSKFSFDPEWTAMYYWPAGQEIPQLGTGTFTYGIAPKPPLIGQPVQTPASNVQDGQPVRIQVNVTGVDAPVQNVTLYYTNDTTWFDEEMVFNSTTSLWEEEIPGFAITTNVNYKIVAFDNNGNMAVNDNQSAFYEYTVVPEFSGFAIFAIFAAVSFAAAMVAIKRKSRIAVR
jgi:hypothetical protein